MLAWLVFDSKFDYGFGHVSRLVAIAQALALQDITFCFHSENAIGSRFRDFIIANNLVVGCKCSGIPDFIIIDSYNPDTAQFFSKLTGSKIVIFADDSTPIGFPDAVVQVSPTPLDKPYPSRVPVLEFKDSPILRNEVVSCSQISTGSHPPRAGWLVSLGGVDEFVYQKLLYSLDLTLGPHNSKVTVASDSSRVGSLAQSLGFTWQNKSLDVSAIFNGFEFAITGAGVTAWELAFLQLPGFVVSVATNQDFQLDYLRTHKIRLGVQIGSDNLNSELKTLIDSAPDYLEVIRPVDGRGRVLEFISRVITN